LDSFFFPPRCGVSRHGCSLGAILTRGNTGCVSQVVWGEATMVEAERLLFAAALQDPANQRFVLLSDRWGGTFCLFLHVSTT